MHSKKYYILQKIKYLRLMYIFKLNVYSKYINNLIIYASKYLFQ